MIVRELMSKLANADENAEVVIMVEPYLCEIDFVITDTNFDVMSERLRDYSATTDVSFNRHKIVIGSFDH